MIFTTQQYPGTDIFISVFASPSMPLIKAESTAIFSKRCGDYSHLVVE
jgi:hypothetical protein